MSPRPLWDGSISHTTDQNVDDAGAKHLVLSCAMRRHNEHPSAAFLRQAHKPSGGHARSKRQLTSAGETEILRA